MKDNQKLDNQLCFRLYSASRLLTQAYHPLLSGFGLTYSQYLVLMVLWEKDAQPVNTIAQRLYLETNTVTPMLQRMEKMGMLTRGRSKDDGRQVVVTLTDKGRELEQKLECVPDKIGGKLICDTLKPETVPSLFQALDGIISNLKH